MSGPILLVIIGVAFFLSYKYWEHLKKVASIVGKAIKNGSSVDNSSDAEKKKRFKKNLWTTLFIIVGIVIFLYGIISSWKIPDLTSVGRWSWSHWFWILIFCGIAYVLIRINDAKSSKTTATETLKTLLIGAMLILFIGFPILGWFTGIGSHPKPRAAAVSKQANIPLASAPVAEWRKIVLQPGGKSGIIPVPSGTRVMVDGNVNSFHIHSVYSDGHEFVRVSGDLKSPHVDGQVTGVYITNAINETNVVSYAYASCK